MELRVNLHSTNQYPLSGILICGESTHLWMKEIQRMRLVLSSLSIYPVVGQVPNKVWGCLIVLNSPAKPFEIGQNYYCQCIGNLLFIPENSTLYPPLTSAELEHLLSSKKHILHPLVGLVILENEINWKELFLLPEQIGVNTKRPASSVYIPKEIKSYQVQSVAPEDVLEDLENRVFPQRENFSDQPLDILEKGKLWGYKKIFRSKDGNPDSPSILRLPLFSVLAPIMNFFTKKRNWEESWQQDFDALEKRNQKHIDRLLNLFKNNLNEALKFAIPLDEQGISRGGNDKSSFELLRRWGNFSLFDTARSSNSGTGSTQVSGNYFSTLQSQYHSAAHQLIQQGDYYKAAFVYLKLIKNPHLAAQTLEKGGMYQDAASVYLKYIHNQSKAAECYEKGKMFSEAIALYKELNQEEKVGDLYMLINRPEDAFTYYKKVAEQYLSTYRYVKAADIYKDKIGDMNTAQSTLLEGWKMNRDGYRCLTTYFSNIEELKILKKEVGKLYQNLNENNSEDFLHAIKHEYREHKELAEFFRNIAYEIIAAKLSTNPSIVSELRSFNSHDLQLIKDIMRFKVNHKSTKR